MRRYCRLTREERFQIEALLRSGQSLRSIAKVLRRSPGTLSRELKRNRDSIAGVYWGDTAHEKAFQKRGKIRLGARKIEGVLAEFVAEKLRTHWSPEQIAGRLDFEKGLRSVTYVTIYRYIYEQALKECHLRSEPLYLSLRTKRKKRVKRKPAKYGSVVRAERARKNKVSIDERPLLVNERRRLGDYERDTVRGRENISQSCAILSIVDRTSRFTRLAWLPRKTAENTHRATVALLKGYRVRTITNDNGSEFADHKKTAKKLGAKIYFAHPRCCWECGTNENTNGLIRQYFPRVTDFTKITSAQIKRAEKHLNSRPRKCLGFRTPEEVHRAAKLRSSVALAV